MTEPEARDPAPSSAEPNIVKVKWPTLEEASAAFEEYALAVGKVAYAWNYLHERLGELFVVVSGAEQAIALAIWYSTKGDRAQHDMLQAAVKANPGRWEKLPKALADLVWLLKCADEVARARNNAVHAPVSFYIGAREHGGSEMVAAYWAGNPRAKRLRGKRLLVEFEWCERYAEVLSQFSDQLVAAIAHPDINRWPDQPSKPTRKAKQ